MSPHTILADRDPVEVNTKSLDVKTAAAPPCYGCEAPANLPDATKRRTRSRIPSSALFRVFSPIFKRPDPTGSP